ncbi:hypothetical protein OG840_60945 [Streptomyces sp. NBC_01764]|uniref:hypothetical protein n=1 Tax=Streptomyces sp. NBC_01764 TaxID=2975935 RepID=UPI00225548C8|nr:hypothetical protein [Streptomyces sp. NBC_01764]MCX4409350.1 hypothetical protein [Streptomyces sp. NBC_01764]MCX4410344.1 hypothetical protein [Streptomyces sp. NBC_01764]MCX4411461.1 hypothetical protein [Streptomyces sp. NBC_01764]
MRESVPHHAGGSHHLHRNCPAEPPDTRDVPQLDTPGHSHQLHLPLITDISHLAHYPPHGIKSEVACPYGRHARRGARRPRPVVHVRTHHPSRPGHGGELAPTTADAGWEEHTEHFLSLRIFDGGHFYFAEDPGPLLRQITRDATTARAAADATRSG